MIRFVDMRSAEIACVRFAFWNTVTDRFVAVDGAQGWDTWTEFFEEWNTSHGCLVELDRYKGLTPAWAFEEAKDDGIKL